MGRTKFIFDVAKYINKMTNNMSPIVNESIESALSHCKKCMHKSAKEVDIHYPYNRVNDIKYICTKKCKADWVYLNNNQKQIGESYNGYYCWAIINGINTGIIDNTTFWKPPKKINI